MITYLIVLILFLCFLHIIFNYNNKARLIRKIPGPKDLFVVGNAFDINVSPVEFFNLLRKYSEKWKRINRFWSFPLAAVNIYNADDIEIVISSTKHNKKSILYTFLKPWLRDGLLISSEAKWQRRRKILTPAFHFNILRQFCLILDDNCKRLITKLRISDGKSIDVIPIISEFTLHSICETAMGTQLSKENTDAGKNYKEAIYELGNLFAHRISRTYLYLDFIFKLSSIGRRQTKYLDIVHNFTDRVIEERRKYIDKHGINTNTKDEDFGNETFTCYKKNRTAMLDLLISAEKYGLIDGTGIKEEVDTFMFEGHDTTASGITYCLMLLANNKHVQDNIAAELKEIFGDSKRSASIGDLSKMRYLERCIKESLRLYPPVPVIGRVLSETVKLADYIVPAGTYCHIQIYDLHRREDVYENPLVFNPDRFLSENCVGRHPYAYMPFSAGPRNCIGQKFAILEMKSVVSAVLRQYELNPITKPSDLQFTMDLVLRSTTPVLVSFVSRNNKLVA